MKEVCPEFFAHKLDYVQGISEARPVGSVPLCQLTPNPEACQHHRCRALAVCFVLPKKTRYELVVSESGKQSDAFSMQSGKDLQLAIGANDIPRNKALIAISNLRKMKHAQAADLSHQ